MLKTIENIATRIIGVGAALALLSVCVYPLWLFPLLGYVLVPTALLVVAIVLYSSTDVSTGMFDIVIRTRVVLFAVRQILPAVLTLTLTGIGLCFIVLATMAFSSGYKDTSVTYLIGLVCIIASICLWQWRNLRVKMQERE